MRVALVQVSSPSSEPVDARVKRVVDVVQSIGDADLVVLPELWPSGYFAFNLYEELSEDAGGRVMTEMRRLAARVRAHLHLGSFLQRDSHGRLYNTSFLVGPDGEELLRYRKIHVFGYQSLESTLLSAGNEADVATTPLGRLAATTCYDLRFPELYRVLVDRGAEMFIIPAAWPMARLAHWRLFTRARAVENQVFVAACNSTGFQDDVELAGHSVVVDPWGQVLAEARTDEEVLLVDLDIDMVTEVRTEFPVLNDRVINVPFTLR